MKWITREHVAVDRVACPWLIRRFIDQNAAFEFVAYDTDPKTIKDGIPFDMKDVELGHRGDKCSFEAIIQKYELKDPALLELAKIVHAADVPEDIDTAPEGAGLRAIAAGFRAICHDDHETLEKEFIVYDALYEYCKAKV